MPAGRSTRCRACHSPNRAEIDRRLLGGHSSHRVAKWLVEQGEKISQPGLAGHKRAHLDVKADAKTLLEARASVDAEAQPEAAQVRAHAVEKVVADVHLLDVLAGYALDAVRRLSPKIDEPTMAQAAAYGTALKEARELVKQRDEMLSGPGKRQPVGPEHRPAITIIYADSATRPNGDPPQPAPDAGAPTTATGE